MSVKRKVATANSTKQLIQAVHFQAVTFYDAKLERQIIVLYSLGADGMIREFTNGKWTPFPIEE